MDFSLDPPGSHRVVRWCREDAILVDGQELRSSFLLTPETLQEDWPAVGVASLRDADLDRVLALEPELVLLGTGARQRFPAAGVLAHFLTRGIGIEVMDNAGAARTFNLLASEGRRVVAAFLLPG